jgi:site-specific DNA recombinase
MKKKKEVIIPEGEAKAVLYCRYSSENQTENSIEGQRRDCTEYAKRYGMTVVGEYVDRAKSATTDNRPEFQRMISESANHGFNVVLVWKMDRFSRSRYDSLKYKSILINNGVKVISVTERISDSSDGVLIESLIDGISEWYSKDLAEKVDRGIRENVLKGLSIGGTPKFGYKVVDHRYVIDEQEGKIVQEMYRLYVYEGLNINQIAKKLNSLGMRRNDGRKINHSLVEKVLSSDRYIGVLRCSQAVNKEGFPRLIDDDTYRRAQERREQRKHSGGAFREGVEFALRGKLYCGECGELLNGESGTSETGRLFSYYKCKGARRKQCKLKPIRKELIENLVVVSVRQALADDEFASELAKAVYALQERESPEVSSLRASLKTIDMQIGNIMNAIKAGIFTNGIKEELQNLEDEKERMNKTLQSELIHHRKFTKAEIKGAIQIMSEYPVDDDSKKRSFICHFVDKVVVYKNGNVKIYSNLFGTKTTIEAIDDASLEVRSGELLLRQFDTQRNVAFFYFF